MMSVNEIMKVLPHRYPFLLVDRIVELEPGKNAVGIKNVTINEPFFQGHFPDQPIMPGVLIVEAMAQSGAIVGAAQGVSLQNLRYRQGEIELELLLPDLPALDALKANLQQEGLAVEIRNATSRDNQVEGRIAIRRAG